MITSISSFIINSAVGVLEIPFAVFINGHYRWWIKITILRKKFKMILW
jgi:hypothetical protein